MTAVAILAITCIIMTMISISTHHYFIHLATIVITLTIIVTVPVNRVTSSLVVASLLFV